MASFILSLIAGLVIVGGSLYGLVFIGPGLYYGVFPSAQMYLVFEIIGIVIGTLLLLASAMLYLAPPHHIAWGIIAIVFSIASLFSGVGSLYGGIFIGTILGTLGGALGIAWHEGGDLGLTAYRTCVNCGRFVLAEFPRCPYCGNPLRTRETEASPSGPNPPVPPAA